MEELIQRAELSEHDNKDIDDVVCETEEKHSCDQCDYITTRKGSLIIHIKSKYEGVRYGCDQCNHKATHQGSLTRHVRSKHEE
jgi:hypothetical protein